MRVLVVNAGSSTLKLRVVTAAGDVEAASDDTDFASIGELASRVGPVDAVGHRVVHGGDRYRDATLVDDEVVAALEELVPLAPLHQPPALRGIEAARAALPGVPSVACFDTAFHATLEPAASTYALPHSWTERWGLRRYGFHGLSHRWAAQRGALLAGRPVPDVRTVTCHLGAGSSCCAVVGGRSVDTTMGFTPLEGLVMATRSGSVDPGLLLWLLRSGGLPVDEVADALERRSGLAGLAALSGGSGDVRDVLAAAEAGAPLANLALDVWVHRLRREIAAMAAAARGLDLLVFTGGIGEHQPGLRARACAGLGWLGVTLDDASNAAATGDAVVSAPGSAVAVAVVTAREELEIASEVRALLAR
jgi:acetate kinase